MHFSLFIEIYHSSFIVKYNLIQLRNYCYIMSLLIMIIMMLRLKCENVLFNDGDD